MPFLPDDTTAFPHEDHALGRRRSEEPGIDVFETH